MTHTPHDALFKAAFEKPEHAAGQFRALLPPSLVKRVDWKSLALESGSFVDAELRSRQSDLLFSVRLQGHPAFVYLLFEHQSKGDRFLVFRMLAYSVRIWERYVRQHPELMRLPLVLPLVVHHSEEGWTEPVRLSELLEPSPNDIPELRGFVAEMGLWLDDISHVEDNVLRARALAPFAALTLATLRDGRRPGRVLPSLEAWPEALREISAAPDGAAALEQLFRYIALVAKDLDFGELRRHVSRLAPGAEAHMTTIAEKLMQQGRDEGMKQGLDVGMKQGLDVGMKQGLDVGMKQGLDVGMKQGQAVTLLKLLELKFGPLDAASLRRIAEADRAALDRWCERVLTASTLSDVMA